MIEWALFGVILVLVGFIGWREWFNQRQLDMLTSKLMARDFREYAALSKPNEPRVEKPKPQAVNDPVLGKTY